MDRQTVGWTTCSLIKNSVSRAIAWCIRELLQTYKAVPAKMTSTCEGNWTPFCQFTLKPIYVTPLPPHSHSYELLLCFFDPCSLVPPAHLIFSLLHSIICPAHFLLSCAEDDIDRAMVHGAVDAMALAVLKLSTNSVSGDVTVYLATGCNKTMPVVWSTWCCSPVSVNFIADVG